MIISIGGSPGSGKSTIGKRLAKELDWPRYYMGDMFRKAALKRGVTLAEYGKLSEADGSIDTELDEYQRELGKNEDNFVIEGRTSWHFIPHSFKIYIDVDEKEGAQRIFKDLQKENQRHEGDNLNTEADVLISARKRVESENIRYRKHFGVDIHNKNNYDFYIDTTNKGLEEVFALIYDRIQKELDRRKKSL